MGVRIFAAIWALVLSILGAVFLIVGLASSADVGNAFTAIGAILLPIGIGLSGLSLYLQLRQRAARKRRQEGKRIVAKVVDARLHRWTRIGVMLTFTLTVRFAPEGKSEQNFTRTVLVAPTASPLVPGAQLELCYDPTNPANFEPLSTA